MDDVPKKKIARAKFPTTYTKRSGTLREFLNSGDEVWEIVLEDTDCDGTYNGFRNAAKHPFLVEKVRVLSRGDRIFLVRKE